MLFGGAVVVCALGFHVIFAGEPNCLSRFDYDEKMLLKLLRIEDKLVHIETFIQDLKETDQQLQMKMNVLQKNMATTAEHSNKTETLLNDNISITNASMSLLQTQMKAVTSPPIAFLVRNPTYESGKVIFSSELLNEGNAFTPGTVSTRMVTILMYMHTQMAQLLPTIAAVCRHLSPLKRGMFSMLEVAREVQVYHSVVGQH
ncbi:uncharacterized protein LOC128241788 isoform X2 [Mya arenaria]|uniref:uncharacterized protein LOC128241788 isoform X2 n=1 Tax=Mya arenaria TaxID=6604 RepID=UPI0022E557E9|nr:uncharacterized protein LOC128241788 isoform X2 [Mya arenaria]